MRLHIRIYVYNVGDNRNKEIEKITRWRDYLVGYLTT